MNRNESKKIKDLKKSLKILTPSKWKKFGLAFLVFNTFINISSVKSSFFIYPYNSASITKEKISKKSFVANAVKRSGSAVVTIDTKREVKTPNNALPQGLLIDPYLQKFFGFDDRKMPLSRIERGQGSGVIFSRDGLILTNAHVVSKSVEVTVGLSDGRRIKGEIVGEDNLTDLAVIKLLGNGPWPTAPLGDSSKLVVGDWAIAVVNPFGLENTVTLGIISNLNRNVRQLGIAGKRFNLIQTDAAINPGNSGGPLLNSEGEVVGINTLVRSGPGAGLGFAIPINRAQEIAKELITNGKVIHPVIGISLEQINNVSNSIQSKNKVIIRYVVPRSPADLAGIKENDIILKINNEDIYTPSQVVSRINENGISKLVKIIILRGQKQLKISLNPIDIREI